MPVCTISYVSQFVLNTVVLPACLLGLVAATWCFQNDRHVTYETGNRESDHYDILKSSKHADYYFAFFLACKSANALVCSSMCNSLAGWFLADPTMTQTYFGHFGCRQLSESVSVLRKDYDFECAGSSWWILAIPSILGIIIVSVGFPLGMAIWMRHAMSIQMRKVRREGKSRAEAFRDFRRKFSYISVSMSHTLHFHIACAVCVRYCGCS